MKAFDQYLQKHKSFTSFDAHVLSPVQMVVVIPVYLEDDLIITLESLCKCNSIEGEVAVLLIINAAVNSSSDIMEHQKQTIKELSNFQNRSSFIHFYTIEAFNLPDKHFGAGLARKIGMDLAVEHFFNTQNKNGIIISLDADTTVDVNYFTSLQNYFQNTKNNGCSIYFEHPIDGDLQEESICDAIIQYELHLRYYVESLRYIRFPYAYHTIGSCFAVRAPSYVSVGGMNRKQGGEEFYFIQKIIQLGGFGELNDTTVRPSSRISTRVPFGTGPSVKALVEGSRNDYLTYNLQGFVDLMELFGSVEKYYQISEEQYQSEVLILSGRLRSFLLNSDFYNEIAGLSANCSSVDVFIKRFYHIFNAFKLVKYINYIHEHFLEKVAVFDAAIELLHIKEVDTEDIFEEKELLERYRGIQRSR